MIGTQPVQSADGITSAHFAAPHPDLRPYITTYYVAEIQSPDGNEVIDLLHPEWASVRYVCSGAARGSAQPDPMVAVPPITLVGHGSRAARIGCVSLPLGWHHFVGLPASRFADCSVNARDLALRIDFAALFPAVAAAKDLGEITAIFDNALLQALLQTPQSARSDDGLIEGLHRALLDPEVASVAEISGRLGINGVRLSAQIADPQATFPAHACATATPAAFKMGRYS
jgi:hypothetical protein